MTTTSSTHPFRFGVVAAQAPTGSAWTDLARRVEQLGYDTLVMPDTVAHGLAVFPALAHAAQAVARLRVGTYVLANDLRHPVAVAKEAATLAVLTGGRFELGLGAGRPAAEADFAMLGLPWGAPGLRVSRLEQSVAIVRSLLAGETVTVDGPHYTAHDARILPPGLDVPPVPLLIAAHGPRMLRLAGSAADVVALGVPPQTDLAAAAKLAEQVAAAAAGRRVEVNVNLMAVGDAVPRYLAGRLDPAALDGSVAAVAGDPERAAEQLLERRDRLGLSYLLVADELMETFAPTVARLAGR
ncbi:LLM class flavin-dependent oxidoreductase [Xylanimonas sp. McL0601]|uniref:LLM class flavin-dependent oxidoreductase n=1 Tax=Xylanimonas sp. McL0601 TaxID=3414739 RepID=UPI003CE8E2EF